MKFKVFLRILFAGAIIFFLLIIVGSIAVATQSSLALLTGGVARFPQAAAFVPKQASAMVSLTVNPEQLYGIRQTALPLPRRQSDRREWQQWLSGNFSALGLPYSRSKTWLGDEITLAVTTLDGDRNPENGAQPGYLLALKAKNIKLARKDLSRFDVEEVFNNKGAEIFTYKDQTNSKMGIKASTIIGNFVLFANQPQVLKEAIKVAQAVNLNLEHSDYYRRFAESQQPHLAIAYLNVPRTLAWLNKSGKVEKTSDQQILTALMAIENKNLAIKTTLTGVADATASTQVYKSLLGSTKLGKIFAPLLRSSNIYLDLNKKTSLLGEEVSQDAITMLAIKGLLPHVEAIAIENEPVSDRVGHVEIRLQLDS